jgi:hypothetical protein
VDDVSVSWLSDAEAEEYERAALASYDTDPPDACDFSPPCAWCGDITNVREVRLSASLVLALCESCIDETERAFRLENP